MSSFYNIFSHLSLFLKCESWQVCHVLLSTTVFALSHISKKMVTLHFCLAFNFVKKETCDHSLCVCVCMYVVCGKFCKLITVSTYIDVFAWDLDTMILG